MTLPFTPLPPTIVPRWYQRDAVEAAWSAMRTDSPAIVIPTGGGKSLIIAQLCQRTLDHGGRVMVLQPSKELIQQNADECRALMPHADIGYYSAGLGRRNTDNAIVFAGIQSCFDKAHQFGSREVVLIDEAHLLPPDGEGRFRTFLTGLKSLCPHVRLVGLTATPFRTSTGALCGPENLLTKVCFSASVSRLMSEGFLCPVVNRPMASELDTSGLKIVSRTQEFDAGDSERLFNTDDNVAAAVGEIVQKAHDRKSILLFCSGVKHAEHVADVLATVTSERVGLVTGGTMPLERTTTLANFKSGALRWLVNIDVLTTGFNAKQIDCIAILRATASPGLFAQICGRGFRVHESKSNCIAEGQEVLTDHGLVPIERVTIAMKVWDGCEYVSHCGIVSRGKQTVITYAGLTATEDHNVWTKEGWMSFRKAHDTQAAICVTGDDVQAVWQRDDRWRRDSETQGRPPVRVGSLYQVPARGTPGLRSGHYFASGMPEMRTSRQRGQAMSRRAGLAAHALYRGQAAMHEPERSSMGQLWRARHSVQVRQSKPDGAVDSRQSRIRPDKTNRQDQQRGALRIRQPATCSALRQHEQPASFVWDKTHALVPSTLSRNPLRGLHAHRVLSPSNDVQSSCRTISPQVVQTERRVWDILNAGPRHRFTCSGLLVSNCLVLDLGENIKRHGPIDADDYGIPKQKPAREGIGSMPSKTCPSCGEQQLIAAKVCSECGFEWPARPRHDANADTESAILQSQIEPTEYLVESATFHRHQKRDDPDAPNTLRVDYVCQLAESSGNLTRKTISEWVCLDHEGFAKRKALTWWRERSRAELSEDEQGGLIDPAIDLWQRGAVVVASRIWAVPKGRFTQIVKQEITDERPEEWRAEYEPDPSAGQDEWGAPVMAFGTEVPF